MAEDTDLEADVRAALGEEPKAAPVEAPPETPRDEQGRFAPKVDKTPEVKEPIVEAPERTSLPPRTWTAAAKAKFATLEPDVQQEILRREKEIDDGKAQWDAKGEKYNRFEALFAPVQDRLTLSGIDQFAYTQALIRADELLRTNPQAGFQQLAQLYGFQFPGVQQQPQQPPDPALQALQQQVHQLTQFLATQQSQREQSERGEVTSEIEVFRNDPKNLYFDNVKPQMVKLLEAGLAEGLSDAYEQACLLNPEVKKAMSASFTPAKPGKPQNISVTGAPGQTRPASVQNSRTSAEDDVRAALEELGGRI